MRTTSQVYLSFFPFCFDDYSFTYEAIVFGTFSSFSSFSSFLFFLFPLLFLARCVLGGYDFLSFGRSGTEVTMGLERYM